MRGCLLDCGRIEIGVVSDSVILPHIGVPVPLIIGSHRRVYHNPFSVDIGLCPPVVAVCDIAFRVPGVGRMGGVVTVDQSGRNALRSGQGQKDSGKTLTGSSNSPGVIAVRAFDFVLVVVNIPIRIGILQAFGLKCNRVVVEIICGIFVDFQKLIIIAYGACSNAVGNPFDVTDLRTVHSLPHLGCRVYQKKANVLQRIVQILVRSFGSIIADVVVFSNYIVVLQKIGHTVDNPDRHVLVKGAAAGQVFISVCIAFYLRDVQIIVAVRQL